MAADRIRGNAEVQRWASRHSETFSIAAGAPALVGGFVLPVAVPLYMIRSDATRTREGGPAAARGSYYGDSRLVRYCGYGWAAYVMVAATTQ